MPTGLHAQGARRRHIGIRVLLVTVVALGMLGWLLVPSGRRNDRERSLADCLGREQLQLRAGQVVWLAEPRGPFAFTPAVFVARRAGELEDMYYADVRVGGSGTVFDVWGLTNITRSSSAAEGQLLRSGSHVAFSVRVGKQVDAVGVLDLRGEPGRLTQRWPLRARLQNAITNLQETGRFAGFGRRYYRLVPPARAVALSAKHGRVIAQADDERIVLDPARLRPLHGEQRVEAQEAQKAQPGVITWAVDTLRNVSWIGPEPIAWLEHTVFGFTDRVKRGYYALVGTDKETAAEMRDALQVARSAPAPKSHDPNAAADPSAAADLSACFEPAGLHSLLTAAEPVSELPPAKIPPVLANPVRGEGQWLPLGDDPFVNAYPSAPPAFYQTFIRVDPERLYASVYITLWDPRQVQLHLAMGTQEPESATGETGLGLVPRDPEVLSHLVAGFNGGFQALHGEFGAMAEGRVYLPPKPYAATVAVFEDGRVGMGSWPGPGKEAWDEARANAQIPPAMVGLRQNLTSVVEDGVYNPWLRWWWGAAPEDRGEQTYIARSGMCLTREGYLAFLWGESMGPEALGRAMLALRCVRGMHLDMNSKHTGLEFYRPFAPTETPPELGRNLEAREFEGSVDQGLGYRFRSRLAVKTMSPMRFPRYLLRDPRDFFFLTLKPVLPGPALTIEGKSLVFSARGLPSAGWPHAFARASLDAAAGPGTWLVRIDLARAVPAAQGPGASSQPLARLLGMRTAMTGHFALYSVRRHGLLRYAMGEPPAGAHTILSGKELAEGEAASRALAIDREGFLLYAEASAVDAQSLRARLREAGARAVMALPEEVRLAFAIDDKWVSVDGEHRLRAEREPSDFGFWADPRPAAGVMFADTKPLPYYQWAGVQNQRVRYFPTGAPRFRAPADAFRASPPSSRAEDAGMPVASRP